MMSIPRLETHLPEFVQFTQQLVSDYQNRAFTGWPGFIERVRTFFTPSLMNKFECVVPGWGKMASYAEQQTLIHVTSVITALYLLPEFWQAAPTQQAVLEWIVLFHDVAKQAQRGKHDYTHGFRSAAITGKALPAIGFPVTSAYRAEIDDWFNLTHNAVVYDEKYGEDIQDNSKLPAIISGVDRLFGAHTPAALVIDTVLLHLSIDSDPDYPTVAPLDDAQIKQFIEGEVYLLLLILTLVDNDSWNLFDSRAYKRQRQKTRAAFDQVARLIGV